MNEKIVVAVTGGIASYKAPDIISGLMKSTEDEFSDVNVMQTEASKNFVTRPSLSNIADHYYENSWEEPVHINASENCSIFVIVPATANIVGKIANGICDDLVSSTAIALDDKTVKIVCPAMNTRMWENKAFKRNLDILVGDGWELILPVEGELACGTTGMGKLASTRQIVEKVIQIWTRSK